MQAMSKEKKVKRSKCEEENDEDHENKKGQK